MAFHGKRIVHPENGLDVERTEKWSSINHPNLYIKKKKEKKVLEVHVKVY